MTPQPITKTVTWFPGGALGAPWPWGDSNEFMSIVRTIGGSWGIVTTTRAEWDQVCYWVKPDDLEPPSFEGRTDGD